jgi:Chitobiase/beta-hexosaminidase C-terminal domain
MTQPATASPVAATYQVAQTVVLSSPGGTGTLYWTQDGSIPRVGVEKGYPGTASIRVTDTQVLNVINVDATGTSALASFPYTIVRGGVNVPAYGPSKRIVDIRSLSYGLSGQIQPYPVFQFSGYRTKWERDRHNPFASVPPYV